MLSPTPEPGQDSTIVAPTPARAVTDAPALQELSPNDKPWAKHRHESA